MRKTLDAWIAARRDEGCWITVCLSCGCFFAQLHKGRPGRRAEACDWHRCVLWHRWRRQYGRAPPAWRMARWKALYGDAPALPKEKRHRYPRMEAA